MNKLTKIGVSALCGSLAAFSAAHAGDMTVTGGADMTWMSKSDDTTGNPIGIGSDFGLAGSGELDNGWSVDLAITHTNAGAYSNSSVTIGIPGVGDILFNQGGSGTGIQRMDDMTPTVWEEADGAGLSATINKISGGSAGATIEIKPEAVPDGLTARFAYTADADGSSSTSDKGTGGDSGVAGAGWDLTLEASDALHGVAGLTVYAGISETEQDTAGSTVAGDKDETTFGAVYAMGSFTFGYQWSEEELGLSSGIDKYENDAYGITFNVNDDLSIGYNNYESNQGTIGGGNVTAEATSIQIAYSMGGASIRLAEAEVENSKYQTGTSFDRDATTLSVSLAF